MEEHRYLTEETKASVIANPEDPRIVYEAVNKLPCSFEFASEDLKGNKKFVLPIISKYGHLIRYVSPELNADSDIIWAALCSPCSYSSIQYIEKEGISIEHAILAVRIKASDYIHLPEEYRDNDIITFIAVSTNGLLLLNTSDKQKGDKHIVLAAVTNDGRSLEFASDELKEDMHVVLAAVANCGKSLEFASDKLKQNKNIVRAAVTNDPHAYKFASEECKLDISIILLALTLRRNEEKTNQESIMRYIPEKVRNIREIVLAAVQQNGDALHYCDYIYRYDKEIILAAVLNKGCMITIASEELRNDIEIIIAAMTNYKKAYLYADKKMQENVIIKALIDKLSK
jgi:hypothetical protein